MLLGYNTNGFAHHDPFQAVELLAEIGYRSVAITLDHGCLSPYAPDIDAQVDRVRGLLDRLGLESVVETGARYLLDARVKHEPTLVSADPAGRARRVDFLKRAVDIARRLESRCVSLWSGVARDAAAAPELFDRVTTSLGEVLEYAAGRGAHAEMPIGFEPEPGMFIDTLARYGELAQRMNAAHLRLTLDVGHLHCLGEVPIAEHIRRWGSQLVNVHIEDMRAGVHEHLMFGEGEMEFPPVIAAFAEVGYAGALHVELSRHSHMAPQAARRAFEYLNPLVETSISRTRAGAHPVPKPDKEIHG